jgi:similar to stage IV sporulation protein
MALPFLGRTYYGYVEIDIRGPRALELVAAAAAEGLAIWRLRRYDEGLRGCILAGEFARLRPLVRRYRVRVRITSRRGLPFRFREPLRHAVLSGIIVFIGLLYILGSFVWTVELIGLEHIPRDQVLQALHEVGLRPGALRRSIDIPEVEHHLLARISLLSWAGVELRGTSARVSLVEKTDLSHILDGMQPADIVAAKPGRIDTLIVLAGQAKVREGDQVVAGQILISGDPPQLSFFGRTKPPPGWPPEAVRARGLVRAMVTYDLRAEVPWQVTTERRTGLTWQRSIITIGSRSLTLTGRDDPAFAIWEEERASLAWRDHQGSLLAELASVTYYEVERIVEDLGPGGARIEAEAVARRDFGLMLTPGALVVSQTVQTEELSHATAVRLVVEVIEDIAEIRLRSPSRP